MRHHHRGFIANPKMGLPGTASKTPVQHTILADFDRAFAVSDLDHSGAKDRIRTNQKVIVSAKNPYLESFAQLGGCINIHLIIQSVIDYIQPSHGGSIDKRPGGSPEKIDLFNLTSP
ncbi:hypothetical protein [Sulfitobacter sp. HGT1]|uniref:hypothetical protein n=1 Tax=Sulfitobacter sp. HGT1 TaxID=2735435 RepID=UPI0020CFC4BB|nr:hypothetical protein [Sulfitobacter sp. HGT1]